MVVLPSELHKDLPDGDVRGVYENLLVIEKPSAIAQTMALRAKFAMVGSPQGKENQDFVDSDKVDLKVARAAAGSTKPAPQQLAHLPAG